MNNKLKYGVFVLSVVAILASCKDDNNVSGQEYQNKGGQQGTSVSLQASSPVTIGMETDYAALGVDKYLQTAAANASQTTFGSAMTHGAVVQDDGTLSFIMPDKQMAAVKAAGINDVWGQALCWYQKQNLTYMNTIPGIAPPPNVLAEGNSDFEDWTINDSDMPIPTDWVYANGVNDGSYGAVVQEQTGANVVHGKSSMAITINQTVTSMGSSWHLQIVSPAFNTISQHEYVVNFYAKASTGGCKWQFEWDHSGSPSYTNSDVIPEAGDLTSEWKKYTATFNGANPKGTGALTTVCFDMAYNPVGAVIWIDNLTVADLTQAAIDNDPAVTKEKVDEEFSNFVTGITTYYKGKVVGWDVVKDLFADDGSIRTDANTSSATATDWFVWSNYLGKDAGVKAFNLAHAADPSALLFISDYGLEGGYNKYGTQKLDSLITYVQWLQKQGVHIDGISTEMHVNIATAKAGVDYMFQKLAATGLKIRISELDVSVNNVRGFSLTPQVLGFQAVTYHDVVASYLQNVPAAQRQDITIWGVNDPNSWLYNNGADFPLLFDENYLTKPAFEGFLQALKEN